jgi:hypothetical protein
MDESSNKEDHFSKSCVPSSELFTVQGAPNVLCRLFSPPDSGKILRIPAHRVQTIRSGDPAKIVVNYRSSRTTDVSGKMAYINRKEIHARCPNLKTICLLLVYGC